MTDLEKLQSITYQLGPMRFDYAASLHRRIRAVVEGQNQAARDLKAHMHEIESAVRVLAASVDLCPSIAISYVTA